MMNYAEKFDEATVRIGKLVWIPASLGSGCISEALESAIDDLYDNNRQVLSKLPHIKPLLTSKERPDSEEIIEYLHTVPGFLAQMERPIPTIFTKNGGEAYSWGYFQMEWVYAETLDDLPELAEQFSKRVVASARKELAT